MRDWWKRQQQKRAQRYLEAHAELVTGFLRQAPDVAAQAVTKLFEMQARGELPPHRDTIPYPNWAYSSISSQPLNRTLPKTSPWAIRQFSLRPPARRAINAIKDPVLDMPFTISLRNPVGMRGGETAPEPDDDQRARIFAATQMLSMPNNQDTWRQWAGMTIEDLLVFGGGCSEVQENVSDERPLFLWPTDAQSIRINAAWQAGSRIPHYAQGRGYPYGLVPTIEEVRLQDDELMYMKLNQRTSDPFGYGYMEVAFDTVNSFLGSFDFATRRASNSTPQHIIFLGENIGVDQVRRFSQYWESDIEGYGKIPIIGGGKQPQVLQMQSSGQDPLWVQWQEFLLRMIAMSFGLSPMKLGLERDINRSTASASQDNDWATVAPVANTLKDYITHWLLWYRLGWKDLEFNWHIRTADELKQAEILAEQYNCNAITVDEIRASYQRPPLPDGLGQLTKTAYEAAIKASLQAQLPDPATAPGAAPGTDPATGNGISAGLMTPFDAEGEGLSPQERAFIRAQMRGVRHERHGISAVAGC